MFVIHVGLAEPHVTPDDLRVSFTRSVPDDKWERLFERAMRKWLDERAAEREAE